MTPSPRILVQSVDGPYVLVELATSALERLERARAAIRADRESLGLEGLVLRAFVGLTARYASGLTTESAAGYRRLFADPLNERGPDYLPRYRVTRVHVFSDSFWLYAIDDSDPSHLPEVNRSDNIPFVELTA